MRVSDCSGGLCALRAHDLAQLTLRQNLFDTAELLIDAARHGVRIVEAPVTVMRRASGESKKNRDWSFGLNFARTVFRTWWRDWSGRSQPGPSAELSPAEPSRTIRSVSKFEFA